MKDYYYILGLEKDAIDEEIKTAHRNLSKKFHPDLNPNDSHSEKMFKDIQDAYECLINQTRRREYDREYSVWLGQKQTTFAVPLPEQNDNKSLTIGIIILAALGFIVGYIIGKANVDIKPVLGSIVGTIVLPIWLVPFLVALWKKHKYKWVLLPATIVLSLTLLGWPGCLLYAIYSNPNPEK